MVTPGYSLVSSAFGHFLSYIQVAKRSESMVSLLSNML